MDLVQRDDKRTESLVQAMLATAASRAELHLLPVACALLIGNRFTRDEPRQALAELEHIFRGGEEKHGVMDWKQHNPYEFMNKAERHLMQYKLGKYLDDESGSLHIVHSAADLLIAAELLIPWHRNRHGLTVRPVQLSGISLITPKE